MWVSVRKRIILKMGRRKIRVKSGLQTLVCQVFYILFDIIEVMRYSWYNIVDSAGSDCSSLCMNV